MDPKRKSMQESWTQYARLLRRRQYRLFLRALEREGRDINDVRDGELNTLLHMFGGRPRDVEFLLKLGQRPDAPNQRGETPLMLAAKGGAGDVCRVLLAAGADIGARSHDDFDAMDYAIAHRRWGVVDTLVELGADINQESADGSNRAFRAFAACDIGTFKRLIERGAELVEEDRDMMWFDIWNDLDRRRFNMLYEYYD